MRSAGGSGDGLVDFHCGAVGVGPHVVTSALALRSCDCVCRQTTKPTLYSFFCWDSQNVWSPSLASYEHWTLSQLFACPVAVARGTVAARQCRARTVCQSSRPTIVYFGRFFHRHPIEASMRPSTHRNASRWEHRLVRSFFHRGLLFDGNGTSQDLGVCLGFRWTSMGKSMGPRRWK